MQTSTETTKRGVKEGYVASGLSPLFLPLHVLLAAPPRTGQIPRARVHSHALTHGMHVRLARDTMRRSLVEAWRLLTAASVPACGRHSRSPDVLRPE